MKINDHNYEDAVSILEELRNDIISDLEMTKTYTLRSLNEVLKLLTGEDYEE